MAKKILVIDVGGTQVKMLATGQKKPVKFPSGRKMTARAMVQGVKEAVTEWGYGAVSIGYPGPVSHGTPIAEPRNLAPGWVGFNFSQAFARPVKFVNGAVMQAVGSYRRGRLLFLGLGTSLGAAMIANGVVEPMDLAHQPYKKGRTYEDYLGLRGMERTGRKKWRKHVLDVVKHLKAVLDADEVVLGGGNAKRMRKLPSGVRLANNTHAFLGGTKLWRARRRRKARKAARRTVARRTATARPHRKAKTRRRPGPVAPKPAVPALTPTRSPGETIN